MLEKIISGGPTGVDRAALDIALALGLPAGDGYPQGQLPGVWKRSMVSPRILFTRGALIRWIPPGAVFDHSV
jgi:hypothetical protein